MEGCVAFAGEVCSLWTVVGFCGVGLLRLVWSTRTR